MKKRWFVYKLKRCPPILTFTSWDHVEPIVSGSSQAQYKGFALQADALKYMNTLEGASHSDGEPPKVPKKKKDKSLRFWYPEGVVPYEPYTGTPCSVSELPWES